MNIVRTLQRTPYCDALIGIKLRDHPVRLDVQLLLRAGKIFAFDDERGVFPDGVHIALFDQVRFENVVFAPDDLGRPLAVRDIEHRRKGLVLDGDGFDSFRKKMLVADGPAGGWALQGG